MAMARLVFRTGAGFPSAGIKLLGAIAQSLLRTRWILPENYQIPRQTDRTDVKTGIGDSLTQQILPRLTTLSTILNRRLGAKDDRDCILQSYCNRVLQTKICSYWKTLSDCLINPLPWRAKTRKLLQLHSSDELLSGTMRMAMSQQRPSQSLEKERLLRCCDHPELFIGLLPEPAGRLGRTTRNAIDSIRLITTRKLRTRNSRSWLQSPSGLDEFAGAENSARTQVQAVADRLELLPEMEATAIVESPSANALHWPVAAVDLKELNWSRRLIGLDIIGSLSKDVGVCDYCHESIAGHWADRTFWISNAETQPGAYCWTSCLIEFKKVPSSRRIWYPPQS